jgi:glycine cleavage system H protein
MPEYLETTVDKFVFRIATDRLYGADGVWVQPQGDRLQVGLTDYAQQRNGDVAFVHVKAPGTRLAAGDELAEVETIKANVSVVAPLGGMLVAANAALGQAPELVNQDPYGRGWLAVLEAVDWEAARAALLDPEAYLAIMQKQAQQELG